MSKKIFAGWQVLMIVICITVITSTLFIAVGYNIGANKVAKKLNEYVYISSVTDADNTHFDLCYNKLTNQMYYYETNNPLTREPIWIFEEDIIRPAYYPADN